MVDIVQLLDLHVRSIPIFDNEAILILEQRGALNTVYDKCYLSFFFWLLCCLSFDLQILITHLSNSYLCLFAHSDVPQVLTILVTQLLAYKRQELLTFRKHMGSIQVFGGSVLLVFVFCALLCVFCLFLFCLSSSCVVNVSGVSILDCPFGFI